MKHTATPWIVDNDYGAPGDILITSPGRRSVCIATGRAFEGESPTAIENRANMEFIVKAVNSYEDRDTFIHAVSRSACLDQKLSGKCVCFSCDAKRILKKVVSQ